jgi:hypothetical protein
MGLDVSDDLRDEVAKYLKALRSEFGSVDGTLAIAVTDRNGMVLREAAKGAANLDSFVRGYYLAAAAVLSPAIDLEENEGEPEIAMVVRSTAWFLMETLATAIGEVP